MHDASCSKKTECSGWDQPFFIIPPVNWFSQVAMETFVATCRIIHVASRSMHRSFTCLPAGLCASRYRPWLMRHESCPTAWCLWRCEDWPGRLYNIISTSVTKLNAGAKLGKLEISNSDMLLKEDDINNKRQLGVQTQLSNSSIGE